MAQKDAWVHSALKQGRTAATTALVLLALAAKAYSDSGTEGAAFLGIPVGAGPAAMGSAYTAIASDAYAPVWNPAGLGFLESTEIAAQHLSYLESMRYEYASAAHPLWKSRGCSAEEFCGTTSVGASLQYLGSGDITGRDETGAETGQFTSHYAAYSLGAGRALTTHLSVGAVGKVIQGKLDSVSASAYAADLGAMWRPYSKLTVGLVAANLGSSMKFLSQSDPLPRTLRAGVAYRGSRLLWALDGHFRSTGLQSLHVGAEYAVLPIVYVRAGYRTDTVKELSALAGLSAGAALQLWDQELAYAWLPYGDLGQTHYFSLILRFGDPERRKRNLIHFQHIVPHRVVRDTDPDSPEFQQMIFMLQDYEQRMAMATAPEPSPSSPAPAVPPTFVPHHAAGLSETR